MRNGTNLQRVIRATRAMASVAFLAGTLTAQAAFPVVASDMRIAELRREAELRVGSEDLGRTVQFDVPAAIESSRGITSGTSLSATANWTERLRRINTTFSPSLEQSFAAALTQAAARAAIDEREQETNGNTQERSVTITRDALSLGWSVSRDGRRVSETCSLTMRGEGTWQTENALWTGGTVSARQLKKALKALRRTGLNVQRVTIVAGDSDEREAAEQLLCRLGLQSRAFVGAREGSAPVVHLTLGKKQIARRR